MKRFKGIFNWYGELHEFNGDSPSIAHAYQKFTRVLAKKLGHRSHVRVRNYFNGQKTNYEIKEIKNEGV